MISTRWIEIGTFELLSGTLVVGDPCQQELGPGGPSDLVEARSGSWTVSYSATDSAPGALQAVHGFAAPDVLRWVEAPRPLTVDSGRVGVIDERFYRPEDYRWSDRCRRLAATHPFAGIFPAGTVSATYFGEGRYPLLLARGVDDRVLGVRVLFLDPVAALGDVLPAERRQSAIPSQRCFELVPQAAS